MYLGFNILLKRKRAFDIGDEIISLMSKLFKEKFYMITLGQTKRVDLLDRISFRTCILLRVNISF